MIVDSSNGRCWQLEIRRLDIDTNFRDHLSAKPDISFVQKICLKQRGCGSAYTFERVLQRRLPVREERLLADLSVVQCREACLAERRFTCRSLNYDYESSECRLNAEDRNSDVGRKLQPSPTTDYFENKCAGLPAGRAEDSPHGDGPFYRDTAFYHRGGPLPPRDRPDGGWRTPDGYPDRTDTDGYPRRTGVDKYPDSRDMGAYPGSRDVFLGGDGQFSDTGQDQYPDRDRGPAQGPSGGPGRRRPPPDVRRCPERPTFEKIVDMRYELRVRGPPPTPRERGSTVIALRQCSRDPECMSVGVEYSEGSEMFQKLQHQPGTGGGELVPDRLCAQFIKVCIGGVADMCSGMWAFDRIPNTRLKGHNDIVTDWVASREECQELCLRNVQLPCRSAEYSLSFLTCVQSRENRRTQPDDLEASEGTDYLENKCAPERTGCEFEDTDDRYLPYTDRRVTRVDSKQTCQRLCSEERAFSYTARTRECSLSSEDAVSLPVTALLSSPGTVFSQQTDCQDVRVECSRREMVVSLHFDRPFEGRVFAIGGPQSCFSLGDGRHRLQLPIPMDSRCGTVQEGRNLFVNHVVVQSHPLITQQSDRTVRVQCLLEAGDQRVSLAPSELGAAGVAVASVRQSGPTEVVRGRGEAPRVALRLLRQSQDGSAVLRASLGDPLYLVVLSEQDTAFGMFGKNIEARTANGERLLLVDEKGCATDPEIFSGLSLDRRTGHLVASFKAFRFPSTSKVNFVATTGFCQGECPPLTVDSDEDDPDTPSHQDGPWTDELAVRGTGPSLLNATWGRPGSEVCAPRLTLALALASAVLGQLGLLLGAAGAYRRSRRLWYQRHSGQQRER
ncbi:Cuticlin-1 [Amphibalanus amphitrite]|uniref:Cuticlin-1 n=1 Tax=Amphibalanus amphitrite TaxID=1232801 RepID=A0A6A4WQU3_AMPAM|nr:Cuticlin-1 [Amphibalanus amphitrite]